MASRKQKAEAVRRLKALGVMPSIIKEFRSEGTVHYSENMGFPGILYWIENDEWLENKVREFEENNGTLVYHVEFSKTEFGRIYSFFFVDSDDTEDTWGRDMADLARGESLVWCENRDEPMFSEFGYVGVRAANGGLERVW